MSAAESEVEALLTRHLSGVRAFLRLRMGAELRARESASDLVQSVCREILEKRDRFQHPGEENFRRWLYATALRKVQHRAAYWRAERRDAGREAGAGQDAGRVESLAEVYRTLSTPSGHAMAREQIERFEAAFERLPEDQREVILLVRMLGLSHREAAERLERTELATRSLLHRGLAALSRLVEVGASGG